MPKSNFLICLAVAAIVFSCWAILNKPEFEPPWPKRIQGFSFSPMRPGNDPTRHVLPSEAEVEADLTLLSGKTNAIRVYSVEGVLGKIPELASHHDLNVTLGAWISSDLEENERQVDEVIRLAKQNYQNVIRVLIGNEAILRKDVSVKQLDGYIQRAQDALDIPVSTAEPWHIWLKYPKLSTNVNFIATHMLPYWEGVPLDKAVDYIIDRYNTLSTNFPDKPVVIGEVGWPSNGRKRGGAVASPANQATFLRRFISKAEELGYVYYVMEAFDQVWKQQNTEGAVGAYWGVYNAERQPKFPFTSPIVSIPEWQTLAGSSVAIAAICFMLLVIDSGKLNLRGRGFLASVAFMIVTGMVWIFYCYWQQYLTITSIIVGLLMCFGLLGVMIVILAEAHEWAEALWGTVGRRPCLKTDVDDEELPMVSIHVPAYNEPPDMMIETINGLAQLDYPNFEVIVMDNNTKDPAVWKPVQDHCRKLGERFRFFHEGTLQGFKAGALNYALARTSPEAEVVAVIDSDYVVHPSWLRDLVPQFGHDNVAVVQAPQDYRDDKSSLFKAMCYAEYRAFFSIGMVVRNERNAIIQHGTMTMVRRSVLDEVGGWAEWCITEDAELGLRIFGRGYEANYIPKSYGKGLMPDNFVDFKKQRFRWAYGSVQILRTHLRAFLRKGESKLTYGQRYHFIAGWLPWMADSINLIFTASALLWSTYMISRPGLVDPPMVTLSLVPLIFFGFKVLKMIYLYHRRVDSSTALTMASAVAGLALTHTIAKAMLYGVITRNLPFFRTPKQAAGGSHFWYAFQSVREELLCGASIWLAIYCLYQQHGTGSIDLTVWLIVLAVLSTPYIAAVCMSFVWACGHLTERLKKSITEPVTDNAQIQHQRGNG